MASESTHSSTSTKMEFFYYDLKCYFKPILAGKVRLCVYHCRITFRAAKSKPVQYERGQRHRARTSRSHTSNIVPERLAERAWRSKSQSSPLNIYFRPGGFQSLLLFVHCLYGPNTCSYCDEEFQKPVRSVFLMYVFRVGARGPGIV